MDFVAIGSPSGLHAAHGIAAVSRGLHVLTEKPIDISSARAEELIEATEKAGVKLGVMFQDRHKPEVRRLKQWVDKGVIGRPLLAEARVKWYRPPEYYSQSKWRGTLALDGGGAVINQAVHTLDLLLWVMGTGPVKGFALTLAIGVAVSMFSAITVTRPVSPESAATNSMSCSTTIIEHVPRSLFSNSANCMVSWSVMPAAGSSSKRRAGCCISNMPISSRCF